MSADVTLFDGWELNTSDADEPRARDIDIAMRAGLAEPANIRRIIERGWEDLTPYGEIRVMALSAKTSGGRPGTEYWLNAEQSVALIAKLRTPLARKLRVTMTKLFVAYHRRQVVPPPPPVECTPGTAPVQARISDDPRAVSMLRSWVRMAAQQTGRSNQGIQGELRRHWGTSSLYRIPLVAYDNTVSRIQTMLTEHGNRRRLSGTPKQTTMWS